MTALPKLVKIKIAKGPIRFSNEIKENETKNTIVFATQTKKGGIHKMNKIMINFLFLFTLLIYTGCEEKETTDSKAFIQSIKGKYMAFLHTKTGKKLLFLHLTDRHENSSAQGQNDFPLGVFVGETVFYPVGGEMQPMLKKKIVHFASAVLDNVDSVLRSDDFGKGSMVVYLDGSRYKRKNLNSEDQFIHSDNEEPFFFLTHYKIDGKNFYLSALVFTKKNHDFVLNKMVFSHAKKRSKVADVIVKNFQKTD